MNPRWQLNEIDQLFALPFPLLIQRALATHHAHFPTHDIELCTLSNIKTGACPEDCKYCPQSAHYQTGLKREPLLPLDDVIAQAKQAKAHGAQRFCMGAAWRSPPKNAFPNLIAMIKAVKAAGLETCMTLGMLAEEQAMQLKVAGLDFYNHNLDTSAEYYADIVSTHTYEDRLQTLEYVRKAGMHVCSGGILGMGESRKDRLMLLAQLANLPEPPESVPINRLVPIAGTPLQDATTIDNIEFVRTIAVARILMPKTMIRLSAGRATMSEEMQSLCFLAGANSIWLGERLLTTANNCHTDDFALLAKLGLQPSHGK